MKKLGLIGGTSWISTIDYYTLINQGINARLGGLQFAECLIYSFNYADIKRNNDHDDWDRTLAMITAAGLNQKSGGAEALVLCANTMHLIAEEIALGVGLPVIHIAEATAIEIRKLNLRRVGLLGTRFTMEREFFKLRLKDQGIEALIPAAPEREFIQDTIYNELGRNIIREETKQKYISITHELIRQGAEGIIMGCTEIPLILNQDDFTEPLFNTTRIHAAAAVEFALQ